MVDEHERLRELLADLEETLERLREKQGVPREEYTSDPDIQDIVERRLEKATQTSIDICRRLGRLEGEDLSQTPNADVFASLVDLGVLPEAHRQTFVEIYEIYHDLERLERFSEAIYEYLHFE